MTIVNRGERKELPPRPPQSELTLSELIAENARLLAELKEEQAKTAKTYGLAWSQ